MVDGIGHLEIYRVVVHLFVHCLVGKLTKECAVQNPVIKTFMGLIDERDSGLIKFDTATLRAFKPTEIQDAKRIVVSVNELIDLMVRQGHRTYGDARLIVTYMARALTEVQPNSIAMHTAPECVVLGKTQMLAEFHDNLLRPFGQNLDALPAALDRQMPKFKTLLAELQ
jgi:hypothetical protein